MNAVPDPTPAKDSAGRKGGARARAARPLVRADARFFDERCLWVGAAAAVAITALGMLKQVELTRVLAVAGTGGILATVCTIPLFWRVETGWRRWISPALLVAVGFGLYYGVGNIPCSLWAYEKMYIANPGSYAYYPLASLFASACLLIFLNSYRSTLAVQRTVADLVHWQTPHLVSFYWPYLVGLCALTYVTTKGWLPEIIIKTFAEIIPTGFVLLTIIGFAVRRQGRYGGLGPHTVLFVSSIIVPVLFFVVSNRRFYALSMVGLVVILSHSFGNRWRLRHYAGMVLSLAAIYLLISVGVRGGATDGPEAAWRNSLSYNLTALPQILSRVLSFSPQAGDSNAADESEAGFFQQDSTFRMAGLEMIAGMFASRAEERGHYLMGKSALVATLKMIPRIVWPSKPEFVSHSGSQWSGESLAIDAFDLKDADQLSTVLSALYADGGILFAFVGMWAFGLVCGKLAGAMLVGKDLSPRSLLLFVPFSFSLLIFFEREAVEWVLHPLRNLVIVWIIVKLLDSTVGIRKVLKRGPEFGERKSKDGQVSRQRRASP